MKIPPNAIIAPDKLTSYLLVSRPKNDKSRYLALAGFTLANPDDLVSALRSLTAQNEAIADRIDEYGTFYRVEGMLAGPIGAINVVTIWIEQAADGQFRFITLKPGGERR